MPVSQIAPFGANPKAVAWAKRYAAKLIKDISKTTRRNIREIVTTSLREGRDVRETADLIFDEIEDKTRSRVIARTEVMRAANEGQRLLWEEAVDEGLISEDAERIWLFAELPQKNGELCPICESMADQRAGFDEVFTDLDGEEYDQPPAHPSCRCSLGLAPRSLPKAAKFNPDQERDEHGRWVGEGGADIKEEVKEAVKTISLYHGTADDALASIKEKGLIPQGSPGADDWALKQDTLRFLMMSVNNRPASVFLARNSYDAIQFSRYASTVRNGEPVVLEVQVPESFMRQKLQRDEHFSESGLRTEDRIPPEWIKRVGKLNDDEDDFNWRALARKNTFYLVLLCDAPVKTAEFNPEQARDEKGRWTDTPGTTEDLTQELSSQEVMRAQTEMMAYFVNETGAILHSSQKNLGDVNLHQRGQMKEAIVNKLGAQLDQRLKDTPANFHEDVTLPEGMRDRMEQWEREMKESGHPVHEPGSVMVQNALDKWADTSGDHDGTAVQYQNAVQEVFNLDPESRNVYPELKDGIKSHASQREYIKVEYANTQQFFKDVGITHVTLYRGFNDRYSDRLYDGPTEVLMQPASSWTTDPTIARSFSEAYGTRGNQAVMLTARVPVERILSTAVTGRGCLSEAEVLVLGGRMTVNAFKRGEQTSLDWFRQIGKSVKK